jgi:geranylgeranyl reductase family protein
MQQVDVIVVGGGPAGAACAWALGEAGFDVAVLDRAIFPRDKVCAGWITPPLIEALRLDTNDYRAGRTFQPITGFHVSTVGARRGVDVGYATPVSFGIRRCEFDDYLLRRSRARLTLGAPVQRIVRDDHRWIVDDEVSAPMLVGAGGHSCPVARLLNPQPLPAPVVAAREIELPMDTLRCPVRGEHPELYFCRDLAGYGWCFRKGDYVNIGFGRVNARAIPQAAAQFVRYLTERGRLVADAARWPWRGHAYLLAAASRRRSAGDGVMLVGDSAGLAYPQSGEGIRPAVESGLLAASTIVAARRRYDAESLAAYSSAIAARFAASTTPWLGRLVPVSAAQWLANGLLHSRWFVRHVVLDRWFLHAGSSPPVLARRPA